MEAGWFRRCNLCVELHTNPHLRYIRHFFHLAHTQQPLYDICIRQLGEANDRATGLNRLDDLS